MLAKMMFKSALEYTKSMGRTALQAALQEVAAQMRVDVIRFLSAFAPDLLREAIAEAERQKGGHE